MIHHMSKYCKLSHLILGQRVAVCNYGASYSIGTVTNIENRWHKSQNEAFIVVSIQYDSHYDAYKRSKGVVSSSGTGDITEYYERPVLTYKQFLDREGWAFQNDTQAVSK